MTKNAKKAYQSPVIEVVHVENEGVIAASGNLSGNTENYNPTPLGNSSYSTNSAAYSDLEDLVNDILTY
jgi:hypothetical protein